MQLVSSLTRAGSVLGDWYYPLPLSAEKVIKCLLSSLATCLFSDEWSAQVAHQNHIVKVRYKDCTSSPLDPVQVRSGMHLFCCNSPCDILQFLSKSTASQGHVLPLWKGFHTSCKRLLMHSWRLLYHWKADPRGYGTPFWLIRWKLQCREGRM